MSVAKGPVSIEWHGEQIAEGLRLTVEAKLEQAAIMVENEAKRAMAAPKSGRAVPTRQKGSHLHGPSQQTRRSAPGEAPAVQTGELVRRIFHEPAGPLKQIVGTSLEYGMYLELGTKNLAQRPWLVASLEKAWPKIQRLFSGRT